MKNTKSVGSSWGQKTAPGEKALRTFASNDQKLAACVETPGGVSQNGKSGPDNLPATGKSGEREVWDHKQRRTRSSMHRS